MSSIYNTQGTTETTARANSTEVAKNSGFGALDGQAFLQLLVTQLRYQDPMSPTKDRDFMAQLAQFSMLEGILALRQSQKTTEAMALIGKEVSMADPDTGEIKTGTVSSVRLGSDEPLLVVGDLKVSLDDIVSVQMPEPDDTQDGS